MNKGFIFGKFLPFHKGHEAMIRFALSKTDFLSVLVCCSDTEKIPGELRKCWIDKTFEAHPNLEVIVYNYKESELPNTSESSEEVSKMWSTIFKKLFSDYTHLITSEKYGEYVADFMKIQHISFDTSKTQIPVSATAIRTNMLKFWDFLPDSVKPDLVYKVVLLGTESTGKTTLANRIAEHYSCTLVDEVARDLIPDSKQFVFEDLTTVAETQTQRINEAILENSPLVVIDTNILITMSYAHHFYNKELIVTSEIYKANLCHLYFYLTNDVEYVQDGTRLEENERNQLDISHRSVLLQHHIPFVEIEGTWDQRFIKMIEIIDSLLKSDRLGNW